MRELAEERIGPNGQRWHGARVSPTLEFGMAVGEREAAREMVIHAGVRISDFSKPVAQ
jgi:hypothetical protein